LRKWIVSAFLLALCCFPAAAQDHPKFELFGGYQFTHLESSFSGSGWNASGTGNFNNWFGVTADFSGAYQNGVHSHAFLFGPVLSYRKSDRLTPFVHVLFGDTHVTVSGVPGSTDGFTTALGGGFDTKLANHVSWRIVQADWMLTHFSGDTQGKNARVSTGLIFRF